MNRDYLGDALDHFKGAVLHHLQALAALRRLSVDPMVSDSDPWMDGEYACYARLLNVEPARVLRTGESLNPRLRRQLDLPNYDGDLFLDPDTGIRTGRQSPQRCYVLPEEVCRLLVGSGVVAVYQHAWRVGARGWVAGTANAVLKLSSDIWATAYASKQVAILFFSQHAERIVALDLALRGWLEPTEVHVCSLRVPDQT